MLLQLVVAENRRMRLSLKSLAHGTATPQSTAIRWVDRLIAAGCVLRSENPSDRRVAHVTLTALGRSLAFAAADRIMIPGAADPIGAMHPNAAPPAMPAARDRRC